MTTLIRHYFTNFVEMHKNYMTYRTAAWLSLVISLVLHLFFVLNLHFRNTMLASETLMVKHTEWRTITGFITNFLLLFILFALNFRILKSKLNQKEKMTVLILGSLICTLIISYFSMLMHFKLFDPPLHVMHKPMWGGVFRDFFLTVIVIFTSQILYLLQKKQQMALQYETLKAENMRTRYEALKHQVDPHFLFNTLSTLDSLVGNNPLKAREYIQKFSSVFRYTLQNRDVVTLEEELRFTQDYASLMQIRYGDNLKIHFTTDERFHNCLIVPLGIQTLVENAIKHNIISKALPLVITIETTENNMLLVSNYYQPKDIPEPGEGVGLANLAERYQLKWQESISINRLDRAFCVYLPLIEPEKQRS